LVCTSPTTHGSEMRRIRRGRSERRGARIESAQTVRELVSSFGLLLEVTTPLERVLQRYRLEAVGAS
jgi:hypothetical protein